MSISCDCSCDVDEYPEFYRAEYPTARKAHKCCECKGDILPGQTYLRETGKWDGGIERFKTCLPCQRIRAAYCPGGYSIGGLRKALLDCLGIDYLDPENLYGDNNEVVE